ncbi:S-adenosyl-L-methionine-dependent methyltransferase [Xylariaceae sp. FL0016]|nr:S-adenosyl-L-methionine-dependent methyltransferase [Xylariaceae sp. FL0016]
MLKDTIRTDAYRDFIYNNKHLFAGKTVLDIGCGTGILSMFCARAGASRVLAVDASAIIAKAQENVFRNNLSSTITCLHGRIEEVALPVDKVDIIVSEWMGYCLLFEAMLPSVLYARDRYLAPGGLMVPSHTNMSVAPVADPTWVAENGAAFWDDVYGFDMRSMATGLYADARVLHWPPSSICGKPTVFKMLDLYSCSVADLSFTTPYTTSLTHSIEALDGFLIWFDTFFSPSPPSSSDFQPDGPHHVPDAAVAESWILDKDGKRDQDRVAFTTGPWGTETHWKQGLLMIEPPPRSSGSDKKKAAAADADGDAGSLEKDAQVRGEITYSIPADHARGLNIKVSWGQGRSQQWALS